MKKTTTNLFAVSTIFVIACMVYIFVYLDNIRDSARNSSRWVDHSRDVVLMGEITISLFEQNLNEQRGYILTGDKKFLEKFHEKKARLLNSIKDLTSLVNDHPAQFERVEKISGIVTSYIDLLEKRSNSYANMSNNNRAILESGAFKKGIVDIEYFHDVFYQSMNEFLIVEQKLLRTRLDQYDDKRQEFSRNFVASLIGACVLIIISNWILLFSQRKYIVDKQNFEKIDDRYNGAIDATNDGVFDWIIDKNEIFLSSKIFKMCGYNFEDYEGSVLGVYPYFKGINPLSRIHPDDIRNFQANLTLFQEGQTSEYNATFRVRHVNGHWIWILARGGGLFHKGESRPYRLIGTHTDITASKLIEEKLRIEREAAENSSKMKMEFLSHMSHEIRTPLTTITGAVEILERSLDRFDERTQSLVRVLGASGKTLKDLINDVLDFSRIENGDIQIANEEVKVSDVFQQLISVLSVQASQKMIGFKADYHHLEEVVFEGDSTRIQQILINLAGNAIKFTEQGEIRIVGHIHDANPETGMAFLRVDVIDTGIGIKQDDIDRIFDRFHQVDNTVSKQYKGTGLGLAISKKLAEAMGGGIDVTSELGKGSTFTLTIPVKVMNPEAIGKIDYSQQLPDYIVKRPHQEKHSSKHVLLVEDYEGNVIVIGYLLEELGFTYDVAHNGNQAVEMSKSGAYDAILMDIQMPMMDGLTATALIRRYEKDVCNGQRHIPIIGMTAHAAFKDMEKCTAAGMDSYMSKPINQQEFISILEQYTQKTAA